MPAAGAAPEALQGTVDQITRLVSMLRSAPGGGLRGGRILARLAGSISPGVLSLLRTQNPALASMLDQTRMMSMRRQGAFQSALSLPSNAASIPSAAPAAAPVRPTMAGLDPQGNMVDLGAYLAAFQPR